MKIGNCWCKRSSPIRLIEYTDFIVIYECLECHGSITVCLETGEEWKERSSSE